MSSNDTNASCKPQGQGMDTMPSEELSGQIYLAQHKQAKQEPEQAAATQAKEEPTTKN